MKSGGSIDASQFSAYADHLNSFVSYMKDQGVDLYAIAVQNEPDYANDWTKWTQDQVYQFILNYGAQITTKLITAESFSYNKSFYDKILNDANALKNVAIVGTHLYGTAVSAFPYPLFDQKGTGKERWMTEHYTDSKNDADLWPMALDVATELHNSMVQAQFNLYTWWYIRRSYGPIKENGTISKRGWCMAQFSKFIRPGFYRVDATASPAPGVYVSAYRGSSDVVVVVVNTNTSSKSLTVSISDSNISSYDRFTTSASKSLAKEAAVSASNGSLLVTLDAQSVTTLRGTGTSTGVGGAPSTGSVPSTGGAPSTGSVPSTGGVPSTGSGGSTGGAPPGVGGAIDEQSGGMRSSAGSSNGSGGSQVGGRPGAGGAMSTGGSPTTASSTSGSGAASETVDDSGGCGCRVASARSRSNRLALLGMLGVLALGALRRRSTCQLRG
jgi:glucuronoarabinoxylan endo-1,4-beta-xylanase